MKPVQGLLVVALLAACARRRTGGSVADEPISTELRGTESTGAERTAIEGTAQNSKASAVLVATDGRVIHISGMSGWPTGVDSRQVLVEGRLVRAARLPRAEQDADGAWSQGVAGDSAPEWWVDEPRWSLAGLEPEPAPWTVRLSDGSGNTTVITLATGAAEATWRYEPVTPEMSSSGTYSGGEPASGALSVDQLATVWSLVTALEGDTESHSAERAMGTMRIVVETSSGTRSVVLTPGSGNDLEALLVALRGG